MPYLFTQAAAQGHAASMFHLGLCYAKGWGVEADEHLAVNWWEKAAAGGYFKANELLEQLDKRSDGKGKNAPPPAEEE